MDDNRLYAGLSGEIVRNFIRFETFLVLIPMGLVFAGLSLLSYLLQDKIPQGYLSSSVLIFSALFFALFTGRFAMAAKSGDYHSGFFSDKLYNGAVLAFAIRFIVFNLFWLIPAVLIIYYFSNSANAIALFFLLNLGVGLSSSVGIWYACLVVLGFFGPLCAALLACHTKSLSEVISSDTWAWLFLDRASDLPAFLGQVCGGIILFCMKYFILFFILKTLAFSMSMKLGLYLNDVLSAVPALLFPVILGRLSGAFVAMDELEVESCDEEKAESNADFLQEQKKIYGDLLRSIDTLSPSDLAQAEHNAEHAAANIYQALVLSYLYKKTKSPQEALSHARKTLAQCLNEGLGTDAVQLFRYYFKEKTALNLSTEQLVQLGHYLDLQNAYPDAAWCYMLAIMQAPEEDKLAIQKEYLHVADVARQHGADEVANSLLHLFCKQFPESSLTEFARAQISPDN